MHILLDLVLWFDGAAILWPIPLRLNLWSSVTPPAFWMTLMNPLELLFIALFFYGLYDLARKQGSDSSFVGKLRFWIVLEGLPRGSILGMSRSGRMRLALGCPFQGSFRTATARV